jgi:hypothetical protein
MRIKTAEVQKEWSKTGRVKDQPAFEVHLMASPAELAEPVRLTAGARKALVELVLLQAWPSSPVSASSSRAHQSRLSQLSCFRYRSLIPIRLTPASWIPF